MAEQKVIHQAKLHKIIFLWPIVLIFVSIFIYFNLPFNLQILDKPILLFSSIGIIWLIMTWVTYQFSSLTVKPKQVILRSGLVIRQTIDIPLDKVESIDIRQSIIGSLFKYGELTITGTGGTRNVINFICQPLTCRRVIEQQMHHTE